MARSKAATSRRSPKLNRETGGFTVHVREDEVAVYHRSMGRSAVPMTRRPLVLLLEEQPATLYVAVSMAE